MIHFSNKGRLVESRSELPSLPSQISELFLDCETKSDNPKLDALNPWHHCWPHGVAFTWDNEPAAYYIPSHLIERDYFYELLSRSRRWVNHNVKYDAHVVNNNIVELPECLELWCTVVAAKIVDSDRQFKGGYGLDALALAWLKEDISRYEEALQPYLHRNKDYGRIPHDVCGEYACQDVLTNRRLHRYCEQATPEQCKSVLATERRLTRVLFETEQRGMTVDVTELKTKELVTMHRMLLLEQELEAITGRAFRPHTNEDCYEILCLQYGLPVAGYTDDGNPSYDKHALAHYIGHPAAPQDVVLKIMEYRSLNTLNNFFVRPYQELQIDGVLHSSYNQIVRTGRMSCKWPNSQQLNKAAKELIHPRPGYAFISIDYSQIEFRWIVHYIKDQDAIDAYARDPDTDFHTWVAEMCGISRRPAKTVNFMIAFGGGKKKTVQTLSTNGEVIASVDAMVKEAIDSGKIKEEDYKHYFNLLCERKSLGIYSKYHDTLPSLKATSRKVEQVARARGYVFNAYGRHRHLPYTHCHIAFNTINQSSAADLLKERTVAVHHALKRHPELDIHIVASVHDETLFEAPIEVAERVDVQRDLVAIMESPSIDIRVPVRCSIGTSRLHWKQAGSDDVAKPVKYDKAAIGPLRA